MQTRKVKDYSNAEYRQFCLGWKVANSVQALCSTLGLPQSKVMAIAKYLRKQGVKLPKLEGEARKKKRSPFDWLAFCKIIKLSQKLSIEFASKTLGMSIDRIIERCLFLQSLGVKAIIPRHDSTPQWSKERYSATWKMWSGNYQSIPEPSLGAIPEIDAIVVIKQRRDSKARRLAKRISQNTPRKRKRWEISAEDMAAIAAMFNSP